MFFNDLIDLKNQYQEIIKDRLKKIYYFILNLFNEYNKNNFKFNENISGAEMKLFKNITCLAFFYKNIVDINEKLFLDINKFRINSLNNFQQNNYDKIVIFGNEEEVKNLKNEFNEINNINFEANIIDIFNNYWFFILKKNSEIKYLIDFSTKQFSKLSINFFIDANHLKHLNESKHEKISTQYNYFFNILFNERIIKWFDKNDEKYSSEFLEIQKNKIDNLVNKINNNQLLVFLNLNNKRKYFEFAFFNLLNLYSKILNTNNLSILIYGYLEKIDATLFSLLITKNVIDEKEFKNILSSKLTINEKEKKDSNLFDSSSFNDFNIDMNKNNDSIDRTFDLKNLKNENDDLIETIDLDSFNLEIFSLNKPSTLELDLKKDNLDNEFEIIKISTYFEYFMDQFIGQKNNWKINNEIFDEQKFSNFKSAVSLMNIKETYIFLKNNANIIFSKIYNFEIDKLFELRINYLFDHVKEKYTMCQNYLNENRGDKYAK
ncbi:hypothetical protein [Spiroplasma endosymbiont of Labia minor]|uniref:hypothetical protein n=1 Tax=Spiroplasma endosymbiont of Labia minor TaxID=3066305 RepID=UPI0030D2B9C4